MRRRRIILGVLAVVAVFAIAAGCGDDDDTADGTTTEAAPMTTEAEPTTEAETTTEAEPEGNVEAGLVVFQASCTGCHLEDGTAAGGAGPQLSGMGLTADGVRTVVTEGRASMPAGLVSGQELDDVVDYVVSLQ